MPGSLGANGGVPPSSRQSTVRHSEIAGECATAAKGGSARPLTGESALPRRGSPLSAAGRRRPKVTATFSRA
jgi:hypothetical protein